jgi:hypothetical protein
MQGLKWLVRDVNLSTSCITEIKEEWSCTSSLPIGLPGLNRDKVDLYQI